MSYLCPLCHLPLLPLATGLRCENQHQFDRAKEGYINLLPVQHKRSKQPGDSADMMLARREFLDAGHYQPLQERVCEIFERILPVHASSVLDIGCGEGYYTHAVASRLQARGESTVFGLDVSKVAVRFGARRYHNVDFCVASSHRLPFAKQQFDAVLRIYAPCKAEELARVVKESGYVLTVTPGPRHLIQFKALIYQDVKLHDETPEEMAGFELVEQHSLNYPMQADQRGVRRSVADDAVCLACPSGSVGACWRPPRSLTVKPTLLCDCGSARASKRTLSRRWRPLRKPSSRLQTPTDDTEGEGVA